LSRNGFFSECLQGKCNGANHYLEEEYLEQHNQRFAQAAASPEDYHGRKLTSRELRQVFRLETERTISNDWVIRHENRWLQLKPKERRYGPTRSKALVCEWEDATMEVYYRGGADSICRVERSAAQANSTTQCGRANDSSKKGESRSSLASKS